MNFGVAMKEIILAENAGFCFGVKRAVDTAFNMAKEGKRIYTFGELIHNKDVVDKLREKNVLVLEDEDNFEPAPILIRSHGLSKDKVEKLKEKSEEIVDLTCPYVKNIHKIVMENSKLAYKIIILGDEKHPEVIGINGWCNNEAIITKGKDLSFKVPHKVCVVSQTTEKLENWVNLISYLSKHAKEIKAFNTICSATEQRQKSTEELSQRVEAMVVIGGKHSSNTNKLFEISKKHCKNTYFVENSKELEKYIEELKAFNKIGVTAGASTPDWIIKEAMELL